MVTKSKSMAKAKSLPDSKAAPPASKKDTGKKGASKPTQAKPIDQREIRRIVRHAANEEEDDDEDDEDDDEDEEEEDEDEEEEDNDFEQQSSSSEDDSAENEEDQDDDNEDDDEDDDDEKDEERRLKSLEQAARKWQGATQATTSSSSQQQQQLQQQQQQAVAKYLHVDDLSSDDEEAGNTIGRVPLHWYDAYDHIGYTLDGQKLVKRKGPDRMDLAIDYHSQGAAAAAKKVYDMYNDREVVLSERDLEIIRRIQNNAFAHPEFEAYSDYVDYFTSEKEVMPLQALPLRKSSFQPSRWEMLRVKQIMAAMKNGTYQTYQERLAAKKKEREGKKEGEGTYLMWPENDHEEENESRRLRYHLPAPKMPLPGHAESYNPPEEYLFDDEETKAWQEADPEDRKISVLPHRYDSLRHVPAYHNLVKERYERCLDLYLCPRRLKKRLNIDPASLLPKLPSPQSLKPFPNALALQFLGHQKAVRCLAISPDGQYLASGDEVGRVKLWEVATAFCRNTWQFNGAITAVAWNPLFNHGLLAVAVEKRVVLITTGTTDKDGCELTEGLLAAVLDKAGGGGGGDQDDDDDDVKRGGIAESDEESDGNAEEGEDDDESEGGKASSKSKTASLQWHIHPKEASTFIIAKDCYVGPRADLVFTQPVVRIAWHHKGDYLVTVTTPSSSASSASAIAVHQISKAKSQYPFSKSPGRVQTVVFHPSLPCLIVVTQQHIKIFHLVQQKLIKKLQSNCKWLSSVDVHSSGDHILAGSYDRRVVWFDLDLSSTPYKTLKFHEKAVRSVTFHRKYPLFASCSDDGSVHVFHGMVYNDLMRNPLLVPLKVLKEHGVRGELGVTSIAFHPRQPWLFSAGADGVINLYQDI
eukprot:gene7694-8501_t